MMVFHFFKITSSRMCVSFPLKYPEVRQGLVTPQYILHPKKYRYDENVCFSAKLHSTEIM